MLFAHHAPRILAIGAHPDDIELGMGGCVRHLIANQAARVDFLVMTVGRLGVKTPGPFAPTVRRQEAVRAAKHLGVGKANVTVLDLPDCRLQAVGHDAIREIEGRLYDADGAARYDAVFTHAGDDTHEDHRAVHEATLAAVRDFHGTVCCYQSPSTKLNGFRPTFFVPLAEADVDRKHAALMAHASQHERLFMNLSRTVNAVTHWSIFFRLPPGTYLEAFEVYKSFLGPAQGRGGVSREAARRGLRGRTARRRVAVTAD